MKEQKDCHLLCDCLDEIAESFGRFEGNTAKIDLDLDMGETAQVISDASRHIKELEEILDLYYEAIRALPADAQQNLATSIEQILDDDQDSTLQE